ncbi:ATP-binding protein [Embleya sp. NBC_00888]|uniref:AAA family ATPase n=1 Tax=Embleya sp. NBC_00888 TaxID=2975960 RepID=UPI003870B35B|nr:ATP-binding protein [Embleya sp. NBC_00888]
MNQPAHGDWLIFRGDGTSRRAVLPQGPPWRRFGPEHASPQRYVIGADEVDVVNTALHLRRPLLVTGRPGSGKTTLAHAIADELQLGPVLRWSINSRSTLESALYRYDAVARLHDTAIADKEHRSAPDVGRYVRLGPLGTALAPRERARVLLIDELDKSDLDLPNDLLTVFEEGTFEIPELARLTDRDTVSIGVTGSAERVAVTAGQVSCTQFPVIVVTSNGERDFPPAFLRRCVRLDLPDPGPDRLAEIVAARLGPDTPAEDLIERFVALRHEGELATDQLLNAVHLRLSGVLLDEERLALLFRSLDPTQP